MKQTTAGKIKTMLRMKEDKDRMSNLRWAVVNRQMCRFSVRTINNLKTINPRAYNWIMAKEIYNYQHGYPTDYPESFLDKSIYKIKNDLIDKDCEKFLLEIMTTEPRTISTILLLTAKQFSRHRMELALKRLVKDSKVIKSKFKNINIYSINK